jgi:hypothetical protein
MSEADPLPDNDLWPRGWDGHERAQLRRWAKLPLAEKLAWLEEAEELVLNLQRARQAGNVPTPPSPEPPQDPEVR